MEYVISGLLAVIVLALGFTGTNLLTILSEQYPVLQQTSITTCSDGSCYLAVPAWGERVVNWLDDNLGTVFDAISAGITSLLATIRYIFVTWPTSVILLLLSAIGYAAGGWRTGAIVFGALTFVAAMGYFNEMMTTLSLVATSTLLALVIGIPVGIAKAHSTILSTIVDPALDFMQTMPLFVYLIPVVLFFSIGNVPGIIATFVFATPPAVRLTALGIQQIPNGLLEAGHAFGATPWQFLTKVEIPLAMPSIMAGVNQTIMLALSMVVIASMVGAQGLGLIVYNSITRLNVGAGIASGIGIVLLAMILDRLTRTVWR